MIRKITLTTEYEIDFDDEGSLEYLFNTIIGGSTRLKDRDESSGGRISAVYHNCMCELHYVAGQLRHMGSELNIVRLVDEFGFHWDKVAEKLGESDMSIDENSTVPVPTESYSEPEDRIEQILCDRRLQRGTDCEYWILDGKKESGEEIEGIGSLIIIYDAKGKFVAQGIISKEYSLSCTKENLQHFLEEILSKFGIDLGSGGTLQFMCGDFYIDIGY